MSATVEMEYVPVEAKLKREAESVLSQIGMSYAQAVDILARQIIFRRKFPEDLEQPPVPCLDDMTEEELDMHIQRAFDEIDAGKCHTAEEVRRIMEAENDGF